LIDAIAAETLLPSAKVAELVALFRDVVDELLADDIALVAPPLVYGYSTDPVLTALLDKASCEDSPDPSAWLDLYTDDAAFAEWLGLDIELVRRHLIATEVEVLEDVFDRLGLPFVVGPQAQKVLDVFKAWIDTFANRRYAKSRVGLESDFTRWLLRDLTVLKEFGHPVRCDHREWIFRDRTRADLLCRYTAATDVAKPGDWLVIENKALAGDRYDVAQTAGYVEAVKAELKTGDEQVFGLLLADGASPGTRAYAQAEGISYLPLATLGYRRRPQIAS
jgi:hypothetical protein